jgi:N-methylhydantoinase A/oxoprolinase/acetone carboxylase beta subunit
MYRIGIDVGGTNTDAVLMNGDDVVHAVKTATSADVMAGVLSVLRQVISASGVRAADLRAVMIGTTHFTNAIIERRALARVGVIRLALPATQSLPPLSGWPDDIAAAVRADAHIVGGGFEFDGREIAPVVPAEIEAAAESFAANKISHVAISGVFSLINDAQERRAAELLRAALPGVRVTLSSEVGRVGLLERENAAILNAALGDLGRVIMDAFTAAVAQAGIDAPFFLTQNDGTLMSAERAARFPILTVASGPTNSMRGAAFLSKEMDAIVVDIGGTTSDVGVLQKGFPRAAGTAVDVGGVRTNFRMPDVYSIGLGGGTRISADYERIGPESAGYRLHEEALIFGGRTLTASDVAVAGGLADFGNREFVRHLDAASVERCIERMQDKLSAAVDRVRTSDARVPLLIVGGGSVLARERLGDLVATRPPHHAVANAVGAAMAQVSGECDRLFELTQTTREAAIAEATAEARQAAIDGGARAETLAVIDVEDLPLAYLAGNTTRIRVKVVGDLVLAA